MTVSVSDKHGIHFRRQRRRRRRCRRRRRHFETKRQKFESFLELRSFRLKAKVKKTDVELEKSFGGKIGLETELII